MVLVSVLVLDLNLTIASPEVALVVKTQEGNVS